jgi:membrane protease YdiL (CAAX protease family)
VQIALAAGSQEKQASRLIKVDARCTAAKLTFGGVTTGVLAAALYVLLYRWLPSGRVRGVAFGALILLAFGWWVEPLRGSNPDFDIVGFGWLAFVAFSALALVQGMLTAAVVWTPQPSVPVAGQDAADSSVGSHARRSSSAVSPSSAPRSLPGPASFSRSPTSSAVVRKQVRARERELLG